MRVVNPGDVASREGTDRLEKQSLIWSAVGLGMVLVMCVIGGFTMRQVKESDYWVDHTKEVILSNEQLLSDVKDSESSERAYIITGDEGYLENYRSSAKNMPRSLAQLEQLVADNPAQEQRVKNLGLLIEQRFAVLNDALQQRKTAGFEAAKTAVIAGKGREVMQRIREANHDIEQEENRLLEQRVRTRQNRLRSGFAATMTASFIALVAFILAPLDVRRAVRQRNAALRKREDSESTTRALFETAAQGILMVDRGGHIVTANPAAERILGYGESELAGQPIELLLPENLREGHVRHRDLFMQNPQSRPMGIGLDLRARRKDGSTFYAEISLSYVPSAKGTLAVAFVTDISKRKADEEAIRHQREDLRSLAGRLMTAQDEERRRIARDLHDDLSQKLAYLAMDIGKLAGKPAPQEFLQELRPLQRHAVEASEAVRHISHQLHPSILDDIGLAAALEQYCEEFQERSGIATHFDARSVPEAVPREVASNMYHIFQESLRNVSKHSQAQEVFVTLESVDSMLRLTVRDEGIGLPPERLKAGASIGIVGMKERAHLMNGQVAIESRAGEGTEVSVSVPLHPQ